MIINYSIEEWNNAKSTDKLKLTCEECGKDFYVQKKLIEYELRHNKGNNKFCSQECYHAHKHKNTTKHKVKCKNCGKEIEVSNYTYNHSENKHFFCSRSCSTSYNNYIRHRSDIDKWSDEALEEWERELEQGLKK